MTDERDPVLHALFAEAEEDLPDDGFSSKLMSRVVWDERRRKLIIVATAILGALVFSALAMPLFDLGVQISDAITAPLTTVGNPFVAEFISPLNSVGALCGLGFLIAWALFRRVFT
jgi:hypothetical protein